MKYLTKKTVRDKCAFLASEQCMLQAGDNEDIPEEDFAEQRFCDYYAVCPYSQYYKGEPQ